MPHKILCFNHISSVSEEKDLGVIFSDDLKWEKQCSAAVLKANRILGMIKRNFTDRSPDTIMALYKSLVRPHLRVMLPDMEPSFLERY